MDEPASVLEFNGFVLRIARGTLERDGRIIALRAKAFALLCHLVLHAGRIVSRQELVEALWGGLAISDDAITQTVRDLRKALGDTKGDLVQTVPKRGYLFLPRSRPDLPPATRLASFPQERHAGHGHVDLLRAHVAESRSSRPLVGHKDEPDALVVRDLPARGRLSGRSRPVITVLPFEVAQTSPDLARADLWAHALVRDTIRHLARIRSFFVLAAASSQAVAGKGLAAGEAARLLGADYFCFGSLQVFDGHFRLDLELTSTADGCILWSDRWIGKIRDASRAGTEIAGEIARTVATYVDVQERALSLGKDLHELDGWESFHRGLWHMYRFRAEDNAAAESLFRNAIQRDPTLARAYAGLSFTHWLKAYVLSPASTGEEVARAHEAAAAAVAADPLDPASQTALGRALWLGGQGDEGGAVLATSVELSPSYAFGHYALGFVECVSGDPARGIDAIDLARRLSPLDPFLCAMHASRAIALLRLGQNDEAMAWASRAARQPNAHGHVKRIEAVCLAAVGRVDEARSMAHLLDAQFPESSGARFVSSLRLHPDSERQFSSWCREASLL
jgi:DNA-binding winged helix-turn-helix (wHTH) protein/TolB-like protein/Flp pilus assembly protein TadD